MLSLPVGALEFSWCVEVWVVCIGWVVSIIGFSCM